MKTNVGWAHRQMRHDCRGALQDAQNASATLALQRLLGAGDAAAARLPPGFQRLWAALASSGEACPNAAQRHCNDTHRQRSLWESIAWARADFSHGPRRILSCSCGRPVASGRVSRVGQGGVCGTARGDLHSAAASGQSQWRCGSGRQRAKRSSTPAGVETIPKLGISLKLLLHSRGRLSDKHSWSSRNLTRQPACTSSVIEREHNRFQWST